MDTWVFAKVPQAIHPWHHELNNWVEDLQQQPEDLLANSWRSVSGRAAVDEPPLSATKKLEVESVENRSVLSSVAKINLQHPPAPSPSWPRSWLHRDHGKGRPLNSLCHAAVAVEDPNSALSGLILCHALCLQDTVFYWICQCRRQCQNMLCVLHCNRNLFCSSCADNILFSKYGCSNYHTTCDPLGLAHVMPSPSVALLL